MSDKFATFNADGTLQQRLIQGLHIIPDGAVEVPEDLWHRLIQELDGVWVLDRGNIIKRPLPEPQVTREEREQQERAWRDGEVDRVIWLRDRHRDEVDLQRATTLKSAEFTEVLGYLQSLRDWPQSPRFPAAEHRPIAPGWINQQLP